LAFEGGLVLVGCVLAFKTRNLKEEFGESKQLIFAMYNIAFIGLIDVAISTVHVGQSTKNMFYAFGIFWGTVFSSLAFVLPRLMDVAGAQRKDTKI
jgi:hypothetical protein